MTVTPIDPFDLLIRKLDRLHPLNAADHAAIRTLRVRIRSTEAMESLVRHGDVVRECALLLDGYAFRHKVAANGGRQIVSFHIPGDVLDVQHMLLSRADHNVQTITESMIASIPVASLKKLTEERPAVAAAFWKDSLIDASVFREWVLNVGRRDAKTRIAHMLCEFAARREASGLGSPERFDLPMSQELIADATGLTAIHVNRMLRALSEEGVIERDRRDVRIADWPRMQRVAEFDPDYLHAAA
jgi:CRP-like cAMP-binding protein